MPAPQQRGACFIQFRHAFRNLTMQAEAPNDSVPPLPPLAAKERLANGSESAVVASAAKRSKLALRKVFRIASLRSQ